MTLLKRQCMGKYFKEYVCDQQLSQLLVKAIKKSHVQTLERFTDRQVAASCCRHFGSQEYLFFLAGNLKEKQIKLHKGNFISYYET